MMFDYAWQTATFVHDTLDLKHQALRLIAPEERQRKLRKFKPPTPRSLQKGSLLTDSLLLSTSSLSPIIELQSAPSAGIGTRRNGRRRP